MSQQQLALSQCRSQTSGFQGAGDREQHYNFKPGSIRSIKLTNFMCHESFELTLEPRVNFIIGPNGSGKSALLTALVVALGGRATITNRAKRADEFVMYGKRSGKVTVVIHNFEKIMEKDQAFKPDEYGKSIIVERIISRDETGSRLILKNDQNKKISERKQELDEILEHFAILINNPICILNQEISKTFLHSKRPEDKFELFMKATNLEQIEEDYESAHKHHNDWKICNESKTFAFNMLDGEYKCCKEKLSFLENRAQLSEKRASLNEELIWALTRDNEVISRDAKAKLDNLIVSIKEGEELIENHRKEIEKEDEKIISLRNKIASLQETINETSKKFRDIRMKDSGLVQEKITVDTKIASLNSRITRLKKDKSSLERSIADLKEQFRNQNALDQDNEHRKAEIERLEKEDLPREHSREKGIRNHSDQLSSSIASIRSELHAANEKVSGVRNQIAQNQHLLKRLKNGQQNQLRKYGDFVIKILEDIEVTHQHGRFKRKPIGPIGACLRLNNPDIAAPLEHILGRNAHAFACDNMDDMAVLNSIFKKYSSQRDYRQPAIITRSFTRRHDVSRFKSVHPVYKTILDYLDIDNDAVYNCVIDRCGLESILFIPNYSDAEALMIDPNLVPRGTRCAYTKDCSVIHPRTTNSGYKAFSNSTHGMVLFAGTSIGMINNVEKELEKQVTELRKVERDAKQIQESLDAQKREYDLNNVESRKILDVIRQKEKRLLELKTTIAKEPQELSAMEEELDSCISNIGNEEIKMNQEQQKLQQIESNIDDVRNERQEIKRLLDIHDTERKRMQTSIDVCNENIKKFKEENLTQQLVLKKREKEKIDQEKKYDEALKQVCVSTQQMQNSRRPRNIRKTEDVREELRKTEHQLSIHIEESQDPEELIQSLNKRMKEIENLNNLKDSNLDNYNISSKSLSERRSGFQRLRDSTVYGVSTTFSCVMRTMKMNGELEIHIDPVIENGVELKKARTLDMRIETNYNPSQRPTSSIMSDNGLNTESVRLSRSQPAPSRAKRPRTENRNDRDSGASEKENGEKMTDSRSLSGGERSFSTVAFVLALWHHCHSPFKLMDEIDVFMDMVTRRQSYTALIRFAQVQEDPGQFIFFSPLELPKFDDSGNFVRVFEMPAIIRQQQAMEGGEGEGGGGGGGGVGEVES